LPVVIHSLPVPTRFPYTTLFRSNGKKAVFEITMKQVTEPVLPEIDEAFVQNAGVEEGTLEALKAKVRESLQREVEKAARNRFKRSEEHTSELQSRFDLVCRLLLE